MMFLLTIMNAAFAKDRALPRLQWHYALYVVILLLLIFLILSDKKMF
jgi:hypothetical protein